MPARPERGPGTVHAARAADAETRRFYGLDKSRKSYDCAASGRLDLCVPAVWLLDETSLERAVDLQVSSNFTPGMGVHQSYDWGFGQRLTVAHPSSGPRPGRSSPAG